MFWFVGTQTRCCMTLDKPQKLVCWSCLPLSHVLFASLAMACELSGWVVTVNSTSVLDAWSGYFGCFGCSCWITYCITPLPEHMKGNNSYRAAFENFVAWHFYSFACVVLHKEREVGFSYIKRIFITKTNVICWKLDRRSEFYLRFCCLCISVFFHTVAHSAATAGYRLGIQNSIRFTRSLDWLVLLVLLDKEN